MNLGEDEEELRPILRAYAIATSGDIQLPTRTYLDEIVAISDLSLREARALAEEFKRREFKPENFQLRQSETLYLGMYNATLDTGKTVDLGKIRDFVKGTGFSQQDVNGVTFKALKMSTRYGKFKKAYEYNKEYGGRQIANIPDERLSSVEFIVKVKKGTKVQGASFNIFNTGRVRFSGGYVEGSASEPTSLVRYIENVTGLKMSTKPIKINNITSEIKIGASIDIAQLYALLNVSREIAKFKNYPISATYEPARDVFLAKKKKDSPFLYVTFGKEFTILLTAKGSLIIEGKESPTKRLPVIRDFISFLKTAGILRQTNSPVRVVHRPSKIARRADNKPAPEITRRGTTCPKEARPVPYSFQGACPQGRDYYVRPNPQGQPCCYRIPKRPEYLRNKVEERYQRANVKVPNSVRSIFGIGLDTNAKQVNVGKKAPDNMRFEMNKKLGFKIGSRQCYRFSKVSLVDIAIRLGIILPKKVTKPILCDLIAKHVENKGLGTNVANAGKALPIKGRDTKLRLGGRLCESYKRSTIVKYAKEMGVRGEILESGTKKDMCMAIQDRSNVINHKNENNANFNYFINLAKRVKNNNR